MTGKDLHPDVLAFISSLSRLEEILSAHDHQFWAAKSARTRELAEKSDGYCVTYFLSLFGGMGSFLDLVAEAPPATNEALVVARHRAWALAEALR